MVKQQIKSLIKKVIPWEDKDKKIYKLYKKSRKWMKRNNKFIAYYYAYKIYKKFGCDISPKAEIGKNLILPHPMGIVIGRGAKIGENVKIYQNVTIGWKYGNIEQCPKIGNNVVIYSNSTLIGNIKIGDNTIIGCNSVVLKSVEENSTCTGVVK